MIRAIIKSIIIILWIIIGLPVAAILYLMRLDKMRYGWILCFYRNILRILGVGVTYNGSVGDKRPLLILSNHCSYLDIFVMGQLMMVSFTPKREIKSWPIVGWMCVLVDCVFIERRPSKIEAARSKMQAQLASGKVMVLYPEGTTNNGDNVLPFKSGFLSLAEEKVQGELLAIQPVSIVYTHINNVALKGGGDRDAVAWYGENALVPHIFALLKKRSIDVSLTFHDVVTMDQFDNRKALAEYARSVIGATLEKSG